MNSDQQDENSGPDFGQATFDLFGNQKPGRISSLVTNRRERYRCLMTIL